MTNVMLAHPLSKQALRRLGLDPAKVKAGVGDEIEVSRDQANSLIGAGYVQGVDPDDHEAVKGVLRNEPSATSGNTGDPNGDGGDGQDDGLLRGAALDEALDRADLSKSGTVAEKQERLAEYNRTHGLGG